MSKLKYIAAVLTAVAGLGLSQAKADFMSILNVGPDDTSGNFGTVTVSLSGQTATITFQSNTAQDYWFIDTNAVAVNLNTDSFTQMILNDPSFSKFEFGNNVNGFGTFDLSIKNTDGWADKLDTISFSVTNTSSTLWSDASDVLDLSSGFDAAAHVATDGGNNTFFVAENGHAVPDGGTTVALLGATLCLLGTARRFIKT